MNPKIQKTLPVFLSVISSVGVIGTSYLIAKTTYKNKEKIDELKSKGSKKQIALGMIKIYKYPILTSVATIASIISGTIISKKYEASLSATALMLDTTLRKYKGKIKEKLGTEAEEITKSIAEDDYKEKDMANKKIDIDDGKKLYWEEHIQFFRAKPEDIEKALAITNEKILSSYQGKELTPTDHWASLKTFLEDCHGELIEDPNNPIDDVSIDYGWTSEYVSYMYGDDIFLHITQTPCKHEEMGEEFITLTFDKDPVFGVFGDASGWGMKNDKMGCYETKTLNNLDESIIK